MTAQLPPSDLPEIAFAGRSNVGKSSMINRVFNRKNLARVSSVPGKTVTINFFRLADLRFADLPGYGYARVSKTEKQRWGELMEHYFSSGRNIALVFQLLDMRHPPSADDLVMIGFLQKAQIPFALVLTKADKLNKTQRAARLKAFCAETGAGPEVTMIPFSAQTGEGVPAVVELLNTVAAEN
jgi:GTP-binding protein